MTTPGSTAVLTIVRGRHDHLRGQLIGLRGSTSAPRWHVVASMGDPAVHDVVREVGAPGTVVVDVPLDPDAGTELPLARARNVAATTAIALGADLLVLLDVDCVPAPGLVGAYERAAARVPDGPALLCGAVSYLPEGVVVRAPADVATLPGLSAPHAARPAPEPGRLVRADEDQWWLFWSLSFATSARDWQRFGGFCEEFVGYGGEDTDVAATVRSLGGSLFWVGGADAFHQHHPTRNPPVQHLDAILRNVAVFQRRWGWAPMGGWLEAFRELGLVTYDATTSTWAPAAERRIDS